MLIFNHIINKNMKMAGKKGPTLSKINIETPKKEVKKQIAEIKKELIINELSTLGYKIKESKEKGKYTLIIQMEKSFTNLQLKLLEEKESPDIDLSYLLNSELSNIKVSLGKTIALAKFVNRLIKDSNGKNIFLTKKGFGSQSSQYSRHNNTTDFVTKGKIFGNSLIGGTGELDEIIGSGNENIVIDFINKYNDNRNAVLKWIQAK